MRSEIDRLTASRDHYLQLTGRLNAEVARLRAALEALLQRLHLIDIGFSGNLPISLTELDEAQGARDALAIGEN